MGTDSVGICTIPEAAAVLGPAEVAATAGAPTHAPGLGLGAGAPIPGATAPRPSRRDRRKARKARRSRLNRNVRRTVLLAVGVVVAVVGNSVLGALTAPGTDPFEARLAMWGRDHGFTPVINKLERMTYKPPKVGGAPTVAIPQNATTTTTVPPAYKPVPYDPFYPAGSERFPDAVAPKPEPPKPPPGPVTLPLPAAIVPVASPAIPDEGKWQALRMVKGKPALMATYLRADSTYTSYLSSVAWMDTKLLGFEHRPGSQEPGGGPWSAPGAIQSGERADVVAAFNSGFRMADSRGGFYLGGKTSGTMRNGAATIAFYEDGSVNIGQWGREIQMAGNLAGARQNLDLIVDDGQMNARINENVTSLWGATIGNEAYVWRTGIGITDTGALVFASGPRLSAATLAQLLIRAGAVRAMQLDINASWTIFVHYDEGFPNKLLPGMQRPATVYDQVNSRDFIVARVK